MRRPGLNVGEQFPEHLSAVALVQASNQPGALRLRELEHREELDAGGLAEELEEWSACLEVVHGRDPCGGVGRSQPWKGPTDLLAMRALT